MFYNIKLYFRCYPRLNEGDQVVLINDRDVSQHTHDQVVNFIRASSEPHSAQLILAVRQVRKKVDPSLLCYKDLRDRLPRRFKKSNNKYHSTIYGIDLWKKILQKFNNRTSKSLRN